MSDPDFSSWRYKPHWLCRLKGHKSETRYVTGAGTDILYCPRCFLLVNLAHPPKFLTLNDLAFEKLKS